MNMSLIRQRRNLILLLRECGINLIFSLVKSAAEYYAILQSEARLEHWGYSNLNGKAENINPKYSQKHRLRCYDIIVGRRRS
jgi:hypothetical protein